MVMMEMLSRTAPPPAVASSSAANPTTTTTVTSRQEEQSVESTATTAATTASHTTVMDKEEDENTNINGNANNNDGFSFASAKVPVVNTSTTNATNTSTTTSTSTNNNTNTPTATTTLSNPRERVLQRLSEALLRRSLAKIDLSQKGLQAMDARLVKMALLQNRQLRVLKLGYNQLGDAGVVVLAQGIQQHDHLQSLDLGFNQIGNPACQALANALLPQHNTNNNNTNNNTKGSCQLQTLYLAGNCIGPDGAMALADVVRQGPNCPLQRLYLTGNRIGPDGVKALTEAMMEAGAAIHYESNNLHNHNKTNPTTTTNNIQHQQHHGSSGGLAAMDTSSIHSDLQLSASQPSNTNTTNTTGMQELFLGGTGLESSGCQAVARLLAMPTCQLRVLSLANCDLTDEQIMRPDDGLAACLKANRHALPLTSLQLSFNRITHKGLERLLNALWGSRTLKELRLDNNDIGDRGAQQMAALLPYLTTLEDLDLGFNHIHNKQQGMKLLMKAVADCTQLKRLSVSGNPLQDVAAAKAVAYALAYNQSLQSLWLVHCHLTTEGQRHIAAGAVSNRHTALRQLEGFPLGPVIVTLGFPDALEPWTNEQVMNFIHLMWNHTKVADGEVTGNGELNGAPTSNGSDQGTGTSSSNNNHKHGQQEEATDPLHFLPGAPSLSQQQPRGPLDATIVVEVARNAFASLVANGVDVFSRQPGHPNAAMSNPFPAPRDAIMVECIDGLPIVESMADAVTSTEAENNGSGWNILSLWPGSNDASAPVPAPSSANTMSTTPNAPISFAQKASQQARSFVAPPQDHTEPQLPDPSRKKRIVEWLCSNIKHLNKMSQAPFDSSELLKLHQHYFTPVVNESGGSTGFPHTNGTNNYTTVMGVPSISRGSSNVHHMDESTATLASSIEGEQFLSGEMSMASDPLFPHPQAPQHQRHHLSQNSQPVANQERRHSHQPAGSAGNVASSLPMLKRKVSYRFLGDAALPASNFFMSQPNQQSPPRPSPTSSSRFGALPPLGSVSKMIEEGPTGHSLPPKTKKARRNRTRISFLPRVKAKLESYLDVCHEKALITMRQLYYVEQATLSGRVNPLDSSCPRTHLSGALATDAETIVVDMI